MSELNRALSERWFEELWNQKRPEVIDELACPSLVAEVEGMDGQMSREDMKAYFEGVTSAIADIHVTVQGTSLDGNKVVVNWHARGTHTGPGFGVAPSGKEVSFRGLTWFEWKDGRLVRGFDRWNRGEVIASLMQVRMEELQKEFDLTPRQSQVALMMAERRTHKEIASELGIRPNTARRHCEQVLRKLGVNRKEDVGPRLGVQPGPPLPGHASDLPG